VFFNLHIIVIIIKCYNFSFRISGCDNKKGENKKGGMNKKRTVRESAGSVNILCSIFVYYLHLREIQRKYYLLPRHFFISNESQNHEVSPNLFYKSFMSFSLQEVNVIKHSGLL